MHMMHENPECRRCEIMQNGIISVHQFVIVQQKAELLQ